MGPPRQRAQQSRHLQPRACPLAYRHQRQRPRQQQRPGHGAETAPVLAEAGAEVLVGRGRARECGWRRGQTKSLDQEGVDFGDGMFVLS